MPVLGVLLIVALIATGIFADRYIRKQRRLRWQKVAGWTGLTYSETDEEIEARDFELLHRGDRRAVENVLSGVYADTDVRAFEFTYVEVSGSGENRSETKYRFSCALAPVALRAPHLRVSRESLFSRLADKVGSRDIEFESEEFNHAYEVRADDRRFASYLIDASMMEHLLSLDGWGFEVLGAEVLAFTERRDPERVKEVLDAAVGFVRRVPRAALDTYGGT